MRGVAITGNETDDEVPSSTVVAIDGKQEDVEDVVPDGEGGAWIVGPEVEPIDVGPEGALKQQLDLPDDLDATGVALTKDGSRLVVVDEDGPAALVRIADGAVTRFSLEDPAGARAYDLATAPDGRIVVVENDGGGKEWLSTFSVDPLPAEGSSVPATLLREFSPAERSPYVTDEITSLAIAANGDAWRANGADLATQSGTHTALTRIRSLLAPAPPVPDDRGTPSSLVGSPLLGLDYMQAGDQVYATGTPGGPMPAAADPHGPNTVILSPQTGASTGLPNVTADNGAVSEVSPDGSGGFYLAGTFSSVNGQPASRVAHVNADGTLDPAIDIPASANLTVFRELAGKIYLYSSSATLTVGGQLRPRMARIDPATATVDEFKPAPSSTVNAIAVDGSRVILGGSFSSVTGGSASRLAMVDFTTGSLIQNLSASTTVSSLAIQGRKLWVGGSFEALNGVTANGVGAIDLDEPATVAAFPVGQAPSQSVSVVLPLDDGGVLIGGAFTEVFGEANLRLAVFDSATFAERASFVAQADQNPNRALQLGADRVLLAGQFGLVGPPAPLRRLHRIDPETGEIDPGFDPPADFDPPYLVADERYLYSPTGSRYDRHTGEVDAGWAFTTNLGSGETDQTRMLIHGDRVFLVGAPLRQISGTTRNGLGAVDRETGELSGFNLAPNGPAHDAFITPEGRMFVVGEFTSLGGQPAGGIAEVDPGSGALLGTFDGVSIETGIENFERLTLAYDAAGQILYVGNVRGVDAAAAGAVGFDVSGPAAELVEEFDPELGVPSEGIFRMLWAFGGLVVNARPLAINGVHNPAWAFMLTPQGEKDPRFAPAVLSSLGELSVFGSRLTLAGDLYLPGLPASLTPPAIAGTPQEGVELTCQPGSWDAAPGSFAFRWLLDGSPVAGATTSAQVPVQADVGHELTCEATATNAVGDGVASSPPVTVEAGVPFLSAAPQVTGTPIAGQTLTATAGSWTNGPVSYTYEWLRDGIALPGATEVTAATQATYAVEAADAGHEIAVRVVAGNAKGAGAPATSTARRIAAVPASTAVPGVQGTAAVGSTLTATTGQWTAEPTSFARQWLRDGAPVAGATGTTYVPTIADEGRQITVEVLASTIAGPSPPARSGAVGVPLPGAPVSLERPVVSGPGLVGEALSCAQGAWSGERISSYAYRWLRSGDPIPGATTASYTLAEGDVGRGIGCEVTATNPGGSTAAQSGAVSPQQRQQAPVVVLPPADGAQKQTGNQKKCKKGQVKRKGRCVKKRGRGAARR